MDLPIGPKTLRTKDERELRYVVERPETIEEYALRLRNTRYHDFHESDTNAQTAQAGTFFLHMPFFPGSSRIVLEGAPGQGKSTVTQYICQINRLRLLEKGSELDKVTDGHRTGPVRAPFRVDLRDYARWTSGHHPFSKGADDQVPAEGQRSLESFLAMQVSHHAGGLKIGHAGLIEFFKRAHSIVVLDGFDEVADIATRARVVEEICCFSDRMDALSLSLQVIVTSRPAAFANSPGFPEDDWIHLKLNDLRPKNIDSYRVKWSEAQGLSNDERLAVETTLSDKLEQPHIRELARNPMQLAILLHLIHVQGHALPDKRTTLYEEYMKLFFNREVEKSTVVREHRELLLSIHGVLAWRLQTQAEEGSGSGSISREDLRICIREYLEVEEYNVELADSLVRGTMERVGALVSRVEGTFEFEVQPLREYFTAWHLYKTAKYSPAGAPQSGSKPDRFEALARNFYWTNVTRFFCGFYDKGELSSLLDGLIQLSEESGYSLVNQPRTLAIMLLVDQVFAQSPRVTKQLINHLVEEPGFQRLTSYTLGVIGEEISLPEMAGKSALFDACLKKLEEETEPCRRRTLRRLAAVNSSSEKLKALIERRVSDGKDTLFSAEEAVDFEVASILSAEEIHRFTKHNLDIRLDWLIAAQLYDEIFSDCKLSAMARSRFFEGNISSFFQFGSVNTIRHPLNILGALLDSFVLGQVFTSARRYPGGPMMALSENFGVSPYDIQSAADGFEKQSELGALAARMVELTFMRQHNWSTEWLPWEEMVDLGFSFEPSSSLFARIALLSICVDKRNRVDEKSSSAEDNGDQGTEISKKADVVAKDPDELHRLEWGEEGFAPTQGLVGRLQFALSRADDLVWWSGELEKLGNGNRRLIGLVVCSLTATSEVISGLQSTIERKLDALDEKDWLQFTSWVRGTSIRAMSFRPITLSWFLDRPKLSDRLSFALSRRIKRGKETSKEQQDIGRLLFKCYKEHVPITLREAGGLEMSVGAEETIDYEYLSTLSLRARELELESFLPYGKFRNASVPKEIARASLANCEKHCSQWVALCETAYSDIVAQSAPKVSDVAQSDGWFTIE